jgi:hypothetical protein
MKLEEKLKGTETKKPTTGRSIARRQRPGLTSEETMRAYSAAAETAVETRGMLSRSSAMEAERRGISQYGSSVGGDYS